MLIVVVLEVLTVEKAALLEGVPVGRVNGRPVVEGPGPLQGLTPQGVEHVGHGGGVVPV